MKPKDFQLNDVVCYTQQDRMPFSDMMVTQKVNNGWTLSRPYVTCDNHTPATEILYFPKTSNMTFNLLRRGYLSQSR